MAPSPLWVRDGSHLWAVSGLSVGSTGTRGPLRYPDVEDRYLEPEKPASPHFHTARAQFWGRPDSANLNRQHRDHDRLHAQPPSLDLWRREVQESTRGGPLPRPGRAPSLPMRRSDLDSEHSSDRDPRAFEQAQAAVPKDDLQPESSALSYKLELARVDRRFKRACEERSRRRRGVRWAQASLVRKADLHVLRKRVFRVRGAGGHGQQSSAEAMSHAVHAEGRRCSIELPSMLSNKHRQAKLVHDEDRLGLGIPEDEDGVEFSPVGNLATFGSKKSGVPVSLKLSVLQACDLENTKMWGLNDP